MSLAHGAQGRTGRNISPGIAAIASGPSGHTPSSLALDRRDALLRLGRFQNRRIDESIERRLVGKRSNNQQAWPQQRGVESSQVLPS